VPWREEKPYPLLSEKLEPFVRALGEEYVRFWEWATSPPEGTHNHRPTWELLRKLIAVVAVIAAGHLVEKLLLVSRTPSGRVLARRSIGTQTPREDERVAQLPDEDFFFLYGGLLE